jgi:phosphoglycolate phosphatase
MKMNQLKDMKTNQFKDIKTIFLDYDGTIHNSLQIYAPAFRKAYEFLVQNGLAEPKEWSEKEISIFLGFNPKEMWDNFLPHLSDDIKILCSSILGNEMKKAIEKGRPQLYKGALDTLSYLKEKGYYLVFISNCKNYYKESHNKLFQLDKYFHALICSEEYNFIPKYEIIKQIKSLYPFNYVVIGDRIQDIESGIANDIPTIGCTYGYGLKNELEGATVLINNISEIKYIL